MRRELKARRERTANPGRQASKALAARKLRRRVGWRCARSERKHVGGRRLEEETDELRDTVAQLRIDLQAATAALQAQGAALDAATAALRAHGLLGAAA